MVRRRSLAVLVLMMVLTITPSLVRAAIDCAPHCCPTMTNAASSMPDYIGGRQLAGDDCRSGFANRTCCAAASAPLAAFALYASEASDAPLTHDLPGFPPALMPAPMAGLFDLQRVPARGAEAERVLRTSPLRLSVVLLI